MFQIVAGKKVQGEHNTRLEYSTNFFAVLHQIKKLDCVSSDIFQLSEVPIQVYTVFRPDWSSGYKDNNSRRDQFILLTVVDIIAILKMKEHTPALV